MIVPEPGAILPVSKPLEIGVPLKFTVAGRKPLGQGAGSFDRRNRPTRGCRDRLHDLRPGQPVLHRNPIAIFRPRILEARIAAQKVNHVAMPGACPAGDGRYVALRQRA